MVGAVDRPQVDILPGMDPEAFTERRLFHHGTSQLTLVIRPYSIGPTA
jgi:hypothetical protein